METVANIEIFYECMRNTEIELKINCMDNA